MNVRWLLLTVGLAFAINVSAAEKRLDQSFSVQPGGTLTVDADGANITVRGENTDRVHVVVVFEGSSSAVENAQLSAQPKGRGVEVVAKRSDGWLSWLSAGSGLRANVTVTVPSRYDLDLKTSGGGITVEAVQGRAIGRTSGGSVNVKSVVGNVRMHTSGGSISLAEIRGDSQVETSGGRINASRITGKLDAETSGGGIELTDIRGPVDARTSAGRVVARNVAGDVKLSTSGGGIVAEVEGAIYARTSGGGIDIALTGANRGIDASTSGGGISIKVPRDTKADFDGATSGGSVSCDLPIKLTRSEGKHLSGAVNGGGPLIKAKTSGGGVRLQGV